MADNLLPRRSLMKWLDLVQMRPGMYLGVSAPDFGGMLDRLEGLILGYQLAVDAHGVRDPGVEQLSSFCRDLERRFGWRVAPGLIIPTIRREHSSDVAAWETFWQLLGEFRSSNGSG